MSSFGVSTALRHKVSFYSAYPLAPGKLPGMVKEWLVEHSQNSNMIETDFKETQSEHNWSVKKDNEEVAFFIYSRNGADSSVCTYKIEKPEGRYVINIGMEFTGVRTLVTCTLETFPEGKEIPAEIPGIVTTILKHGKGGYNGPFKLKRFPITCGIETLETLFGNWGKPFLLPVVFLSKGQCRFLDSNNLAGKLYRKASVIAEREYMGEKQGSIFRKLDVKARYFLNKSNTKISPVRIFFPDGNNFYIELGEIVPFIEQRQYMQHQGVDIQNIKERARNIKAYGYRAHNTYCQEVFEIIESLNSCQKEKLTSIVNAKNTDKYTGKLEEFLNKTIVFKVHRKIIRKTNRRELKKILEIIQNFP